MPAIAGVLNAVFVVLFYLAFAYWHAPWWVLVCMGFTYSVSIGWNINSVCHNFVHNPFFVSPFLNRAFSLMQSLALGFSQVAYDAVHARHHRGNSDRPDDNGDTIDWVSIYRHSHDHDDAESVWAYTFFSYIRDDPIAIIKELKVKDEKEAVWGIIEIVGFMALYIGMFFVNWKFMLFFIPFYYFGHCLSYLNGYYLHYGADTENPIAWGVSSYHKLYNWIWFNNGYHAEHHFRLKMHWTEDAGIPSPDRRRPGSRRGACDLAAARARFPRPLAAGEKPLRHGRARHQNREGPRSAADAEGVKSSFSLAGAEFSLGKRFNNVVSNFR